MNKYQHKPCITELISLKEYVKILKNEVEPRQAVFLNDTTESVIK